MSKRFNLEFLKTFLVAAEVEQLGEAARIICLSPSAVTSQIKRIEEQVGTPLFIRGNKTLKLTAAGEALKGYATALLDLNDAAFHALAGEEWDGSLTFGIPTDYIGSFMEIALPQLHTLIPTRRIIVTADRSRRIREGVGEGHIDIAVVAMESQFLDESELWSEKLVWVQEKGARLSAREELPVALFSDDCVMNSYALSCLRRCGIPFNVAFKSIAMDNLVDAVRCGCAALLPTSLVQNDFECLPASYIQCPHELHMGLLTSPCVDYGILQATSQGLADWIQDRQKDADER